MTSITELACCSICLESIVKINEVTKPCEHTFHTECITRWLENNRSCPLCRTELMTVILPPYGYNILYAAYGFVSYYQDKTSK